MSALKPIEHPANANPLVRGLCRFSYGLAVAEGAGLGFCLLALIFLATWQFLGRNLNNVGVPFPAAPMWVNGALRHSVFFIGFLGAAFATHAGKHIRVDAVTRNLKGRVRTVVKLLTTFLPLVVCAVCIAKGWEFHEAEQPDISQLDEVINSRVGSLAIPLGFGLIFLHMLVHLAVDASWVVSGQEPPPESHGEATDLFEEAST